MSASAWHLLSILGTIIAVLCGVLIGLGLLIAGIFIFRRFRQKKPVSTPLPQPPLAPLPIMAATVVLPKCPQCHMPLAQNAPEGLCPQCLAKVALGSDPAAPGATINVNPLAQAAPATRVAPDPGQLAAQFPQLEIIELLGMGGMGMVYKARQLRLDRIVALKILPVESQQHPSFAERFNREAKALAKLNHPGIVNVYDFGQTAQYYFFVMEFVDGMNLRQLLNTEKVTPRQALELVVQICTALQYAHDEGVVHRDIKPENILLNKKGQVKIADFGLAKLLGAAPDTALTMSQAAMGTLNYMAPEQRQNAQGVDHRADIYSLGVVFYEMLTGEVPMGRFEAPSKRVQVDVRLDEVVLRALEREPARRYQQVSEVKSNVETITATPPAPPVTPVAPPPPMSAPAAVTIPPRFSNWVVKPMIGLVLLWMATWFLAGDLHHPFGVILPPFWADLVLVLLISAPHSLVFAWRYQIARQGLRWRQLPPAIRRRGYLRFFTVTAACIAATFIGAAIFPMRSTTWQEEGFVPQSHACEKVGLAGAFARFSIPVAGNYSVVPQSWTVELKIYCRDTTPEAMTLILPGLRADYETRFGHGRSVLSFEVLTNWFVEGAHLDISSSQVQAEAGQLMQLFKSYQNTPPGTWEEFSNLAKADLRSFSFGGSFTFTRLNTLSYIFLSALMAAVCVYYFLALRTIKRTFAEGRAEIEAGRWTPPAAAPQRFLAAIKVLFVLGLISMALALVAWWRDESGAMLLTLLSLGIFLVLAVQLKSRQQPQKEFELFPREWRATHAGHSIRVRNSWNKGMKLFVDDVCQTSTTRVFSYSKTIPILRCEIRSGATSYVIEIYVYAVLEVYAKIVVDGQWIGGDNF